MLLYAERFYVYPMYFSRTWFKLSPLKSIKLDTFGSSSNFSHDKVHIFIDYWIFISIWVSQSISTGCLNIMSHFLQKGKKKEHVACVWRVVRVCCDYKMMQPNFNLLSQAQCSHIVWIECKYKLFCSVKSAGRLDHPLLYLMLAQKMLT